MRGVRACADAFPEFSPRVYSFVFLFFEGLAVITKELVRNLITSAIAVFIMSVIVLADIGTAFLVLLMVVFIDVDLIGYIYYTGVSLNSVSTSTWRNVNAPSRRCNVVCA